MLSALSTVSCSSFPLVPHHTSRRKLRSFRCRAQQHDSTAGFGARLEPASNRNLVLAVDDSEESEYAFAWTRDNLYRPGDTLHLLHCVPGVPSLLTLTPKQSPPASAPDDSTSKLMAQASSKLMKRLGGTLSRSQVNYEMDVISEPGAGSKSTIGDVLCDRATAMDAAALVIASRQRGGLQELLMGSVANHCAQHCSRPLVVLHRPRNLDEELLVATQRVDGSWDEMEGCSGALCEEPGRSEGHPQPTTTGRTILVAVDNSEGSLKSCEWAVQHMYRPGDQLLLFHVIPALLSSALGFATDGMLYPVALTKSDLANEEATWKDLIFPRFTEMLDAAGVAHEQQILTEYAEDPPTAVGRMLCAMAAHRGASCIVLASHSQGALMSLLIGSTASYCVHNSPVPVAVLH